MLCTTTHQKEKLDVTLDYLDFLSYIGQKRTLKFSTLFSNSKIVCIEARPKFRLNELLIFRGCLKKYQLKKLELMLKYCSDILTITVANYTNKSIRMITTIITALVDC